MGNAAMRKAQGDMLTNMESDQSESMDSLVRFNIFVYIFAWVSFSYIVSAREMFLFYY